MMLDEHLFWMNRNQQGLYESGYLLDLSTLQTEFDDPEVFDVASFLHSLKIFSPTDYEEGAYRGDDTFTIRKILTVDELRNLLTWKDFDPFESHASGSFDESYPEFVDKNFRRCRYAYNFTGYTATHLPTSGLPNPLISKYKELLGLSDKDMEYTPTAEDKATKDIQDTIRREGIITFAQYREILRQYNLEMTPIPTILIKTYADYKNIIMAALNEASEHRLLGSIGDKQAKDVYHRLKLEDYCVKHNKIYEELTPEDYESYYEEEDAKKEAESADYERD